jgi:hypothetical protein
VQLRAAKAGNSCPARTPSERGRDARPGQACRWLENAEQKNDELASLVVRRRTSLVMTMMVASTRLWRQLGEKEENLVYHLGIPK